MQMLIVLVNYNGSDLTIACLESLLPELEALPGARVAVCDNGSAAGDSKRIVDAIARLGLEGRVELRRLRRNQGFTGGNNVLLREALASPAPPDAIMLLNNDTIVRAGAIQELVAFMASRPDVGVCGSRLEHEDGESQLAARRFLTAVSEFESFARTGVITRLLSRWQVAPPETDRSEPHECDWLPGAALVIRREVLEAVGLLDEGLYTYFDDVDYCHRARRAGWPAWYVPMSRIVHLVGKTTHITEKCDRPKRRPSYWFDARRRYFLGRYGAMHAAAADLAAVIGLALYKMRITITREPDPDPPHLMADLIRHSVFARGIRPKAVKNPLTGAPVESSAEEVFAL